MQYSLTPKQAELLTYIKGYMAHSGGIAPTYAEMVDGTSQVSKSGINRLLKQLKERGHVTAMPHRSRSLVLIEGEQ